MKHLMIDLDTLGTTPQAPIIAIGAVMFDPKTGEMGAEFYKVINFESACERRVPEAGTVKWWLGQSDEARKAVTRGKADMKETLREFIAFYREQGDGVKVWGNGATFDISMLEDCYRTYRGNAPWKFWDVRDVRTVVEMAEQTGVKRNAFTFDGTAHQALDDAKHQAKYVSAMWQKLTGGAQ